MKAKTPHKIIITLILVLYFIFGYLPIGRWNAARGVYHTVGFPFEEYIPFLSPFIFGYLLVYGSVILIYLSIPSWEIFKKMAWGYFILTTLHYLFFIFYPVRMIWRPEILAPSGFFEGVAAWMFSLDNTYNCFPSLHVAYPTLATVLSWRFAPRWRGVFLALALITAVSVVLVKQHYLLDAVAGAGMALLVGAWSPQKRSASDSDPRTAS